MCEAARAPAGVVERRSATEEWVPVARSNIKKKPSAEYKHAEEAVLRPDVGTQAQFKKKKPPKRYRYDDSLAPAMDWDGQNSARELGEWLWHRSARRPISMRRMSSMLRGVSAIPRSRGLRDAIDRLTALGEPFLNWSGKAERLVV